MMRKHFRFFFYLSAVIGFCSAHAGSYEDFFSAIQRDDPAAVSRLLERGFDPNTRNPKGQPGLTQALLTQSNEVARLLVRHPGLEVDAINEAGETALMMAALRGQRELVAALLDRGASLKRPGWTPLHYAATGPDAGLVTVLLDRGAPIDAESPNRSTPLMMAARYGPEDAVRVLLARGADPRRRNDQGLQAADFARLGARPPLAEQLDRLAR